MSPTETSTSRRPRVADGREAEILEATIRVLIQTGYDRLTMDQVAAEAHASKATLYRHWSTKAELVVDAISRAKGMPHGVVADTGTLRGDLNSTWCSKAGWGSQIPMSVMGGLMTALHTDSTLSEAFRKRFMAPRLGQARQVFERALQRGEIDSGVDLDLILSLLPAMCTYREAILGQPVDEAFVRHVIDDVVLPAAGCQT